LRSGDHLGVLKKGENVGTVDGAKGNRGLRARFEIEGKFSQAFVRNKKGESILDDQQYMMPIVNVFHAGIRKHFRGNGVSATQLLGAMRGLKKLSRTYAGDGMKQAKIAQILRRVRDELPMSLMSVIFQEPGVHRFQLGRQLGPTVENEILSRCFPTGDLDGVVKERTADVTPQLIQAVFGNAKAQPATHVPITEHNYTRTGIGVCHQYWRDSLGKGVKIGGVLTKCDASGLKRLLEFTGKDEGMMFAISQAANQASVAGAPAMILTKGVKVQGQEVPLLEAANERIFLLPYAGTAEVSRQNAGFVVTANMTMDGNQQAFSFKNGAMDQGTGRTRLLDFGISNFEMEIAVSLARAGNRINLALTKAEFVVTTIPLPD
jgi:hypothetical protein